MKKTTYDEFRQRMNELRGPYAKERRKAHVEKIKCGLGMHESNNGGRYNNFCVLCGVYMGELSK